jgi:hypothetical protein
MVRAGDQARRSVGIGEVRERPHGVADDRHVRLRQRQQLIVGVDRLRALARVDGDRGQRGHQTAAVEDALDQRQHRCVDRHLLVETPVREEIVDAHGARALEQVLRRLHVEVLLEPVQVLQQRRDQLRLDHALEDRIAVTLDGGGVGIEVVHDALLLDVRRGRYCAPGRAAGIARRPPIQRCVTASCRGLESDPNHQRAAHSPPGSPNRGGHLRATDSRNDQ